MLVKSPLWGRQVQHDPVHMEARLSPKILHHSPGLAADPVQELISKVTECSFPSWALRAPEDRAQAYFRKRPSQHKEGGTWGSLASEKQNKYTTTKSALSSALRWHVRPVLGWGWGCLRILVLCLVLGKRWKRLQAQVSAVLSWSCCSAHQELWPLLLCYY